MVSPLTEHGASSSLQNAKAPIVLYGDAALASTVINLLKTILGTGM